MQVRVLGPVGVGCRPAAAGSPKQQILLAALALDLNQAVPVEILVERLWGDHPPTAARSSLYAYVTRIRRLLAATADSRPPIRLCRRGSGYALEADPETVDIHRVRDLVRRAREAGGSPEALALLRQALGCWRGEPLAGLSGDWVERVREGLERERLDVLIARFDLELRLSRPEPVIGELSAAVAAHPLAEPLVGQLMVALYRSGRVSEALACFADARRRIREHLGVEPGRDLRDLHQRMLRDDPDLGVDHAPPPRTLAVATSATAVTPAQLPPDVAAFVGRGRELRTLDTMSTTGPAPVIVITGPAGVGKTALAVHWAHRAAARFDHGQLYVDMLGYHERAPMAPAVALARCLRALGVTTIPSDIDELTGAFRSLVRGRRLLLVLDNVRSAEQVRPLLPAGPGCCVVVTSRQRLDGLVARDGAQMVTLKAQDTDEACALLEQLIGARRVSA
ncbi:MAG: AAA family ATPase, partial [Dactylosporangium sp.]|nr:AAA family ATPase [Dactylosporangium sp.]